MKRLPIIAVGDLVAARPPKHSIPLDRPYAFYAEQERAPNGLVEDVSTLLLSNRECPFRCLMCDLWKNTLDGPTPLGALVSQVQFALDELPAAPHIKLYNSGNFFDAKAVPASDLPKIAALVAEHRTVIVENHPALCGDACSEFADMIGGDLEVAMGLETAHEPTLAWLNKNMTLDDFCRASERLRASGIFVRSFVLLRPPGMSREEGIEWAVRSTQYALQAGARCVSIVPTRAGNGLMDKLQQDGIFEPPTLADAEEALSQSLAQRDVLGPKNARVFLDLWDLPAIATCSHCSDARVARLAEMNFSQRELPPVECGHCA